MQNNILYYGDNLDVLRKYVLNESVDLIYLDPPFNSKADYNILFKEPTGEESAAQIQAFSDFWHWDKNVEKTYLELQEDPKFTDTIQSLHRLLGRNDMMAYLVMMTIRLRELHRVLKPTGSIYLHCDPTASHYLKIIMDLIFGAKNFRNEIIWQRFTFHADAQRYGRVHDILLFYTKTDEYYWKTQYGEHKEAYKKSHFTHTDPNGRVYRLDNAIAKGQGPPRYFNGKLLEPPVGTHWRWSQENIDCLIKQGVIVFTKTGRPAVKRYLDTAKPAIHSIWTDIPPINSMSKERVGFQTQKPIKLLERIVESSCPEDGLVLDPFCGCGTTILATQKLHRKWIGIDITHLAISIIKSRLKEMYLVANRDYKVIGEPVDLASATKLMEYDPTGYQFQCWAVSRLDARPTNPDGKKGADKGVDGWLFFREGDDPNLRKIVVQAKGGTHIGANIVRDLLGTVQNTKSAMGILITLHEPTQPMKEAAMEAEYYESSVWKEKYPKIQIITIEELFSGKRPKLPLTLITNEGLAHFKS